MIRKPYLVRNQSKTACKSLCCGDSAFRHDAAIARQQIERTVKMNVERSWVEWLGPANVLGFEAERLLFEIWNDRLDPLANIFPLSARCKLAKHEQERRWCSRDLTYCALGHCRVELWA